jgi:hypothetical protein
MSRVAYSTDLTNDEWTLIEPYVRTNGYDRSPLHRKRELRHFLPVARRWTLAPVSARFAALAHGLKAVRGLARGGHLGPSAYRTAPATALIHTRGRTHGRGHRLTIGAHERTKESCHGDDAGKQVAVRKRPVFVDTQGLLLPLPVLVQTASV